LKTSGFIKKRKGRRKRKGLSEDEAKAKKAEMKEKQKSMAKQLASYGDVWVNDAFGTAHRAHASTAIIAQFEAEKICGYLIQAELENAQKVLDNPRQTVSLPSWGVPKYRIRS
jgi:phosphoglycerate kinase